MIFSRVAAMIARIRRSPSRNMLETSALSGLSTFAKMVLGFISNKVLSIYLGPGGFALIGQFNNFSSIVLGLGNGGISVGVTKYVAEFFDDREKRDRIIRTGFYVMIISSLVMGILAAAFRNEIADRLFHDTGYSPIFIGFSVAIVFSSFNVIFAAILNGLKMVRKLVFVNISTAFLTVAILLPMVMRWGLIGAFAASLIVLPVVSVLSLIILRKIRLDSEALKPRFDKMAFSRLIRFSLMTLTTTVAAPISMILIRNSIVSNLSLESAGYWQGMVKLSDIYLSVLTSSLSMYYLPRLSEIKGRDELRQEIFLGYKILLPLMVCLVLGIYFLKDVIIHLLFTPEFYPMRELFAFQLTGDFLKIACWLLSYIIVAKAMTKIFVLTEILFNASFVVLAVVLMKYFRLVGVTYAHAANYFLYLVFLVVVFRNTLFPTPSRT